MLKQPRKLGGGDLELSVGMKSLGWIRKAMALRIDWGRLAVFPDQLTRLSPNYAGDLALDLNCGLNFLDLQGSASTLYPSRR